MNNIKFKPIFVEGYNLDETWFKILNQVYENGRIYKKTAGSRTGMNVYALDFLSGFIHNPHQRPLSPTMPQGLNSVTTDENIEKYFTEYLMNSKLEKNEHYRYSTWINGGKCNLPGFEYELNQTEFIIDHFKKFGYGNTHCYMHIGNSLTNTIYLNHYFQCHNCGQKYSKQLDNKCPKCKTELTFDEAERPTTPCLRGLDFRIIENYLVTNVIYRSWDAMAWPENMGGFTLLNEYIAEHLKDVKSGPLSFTCKSFHCPEDVFDILKLKIGKYK